MPKQKTAKTKTTLPDFKDDVLPHCQALLDNAFERVKLQDAMEATYELEWDKIAIEKKPVDFLETKDTQPADSIDWATKVLASGEPSITLIIPDDALAEAGTEAHADDATTQDATQDEQPLDPFATPDTMQAEPVAPMADQDAAQELAEDFKQAMLTALRQSDKRTDVKLLKALTKHGFLYDQMVLKVWDLRLTKLWNGDDVHFNGQSPFVFIAPDPRTVFAEWDELGLCAVFQRSTKSVRAIKRIYGDKLGDGKLKLDEIKDANNNIALAEYWTRDAQCVWIERTLTTAEERESDESVQSTIIIQDVKQNPLGFIPFIVRTCAGSRDEIHPFLENGYKSGMFRASSAALTMVATLALRYSLGKLKQTGVNSEDDIVNVNWASDEIVPLRQGQDILPLLTPVPQDLYRALGEISMRVDSTTISKIIAGQNTSGATAASAINLLTHGAELVLGDVKNALQDVYSHIPNMLLSFLRCYGDALEGTESDLELWADNGIKTIKYGMLPRWINATVKITANLPQDKIALMQAAIGMLNSTRPGQEPIFSRLFIKQLSGVDDPEADDKQIEAEKKKAQAAQLAPEVNGMAGMFGQQQPQPQGEGMPPMQNTPANVQMPVEQSPQAPQPGGLDIASMMQAMGGQG